MDQKLKIAQIAPFWMDVPPLDYGGTERVVSNITEELVKRGHEVTLFASSNSQTKARLVSPISAELLKTIQGHCDTSYSAINTYVNHYVFQKASEFNVIHSHVSYFSFYFCDFVKTPVVHTLHDQLPRKTEAENELYKKFRRLNFISISNEFRTHFDLNYIATVYHGLDFNYFPFNPKGGENLLWIGRINKFKGELEAIEVAKRTDKKLILALSMRKDALTYFEEKIKPQIDNNITVLPDLKYEDTGKYYGSSKAFIFPVIWKEPFGLIMIEAMGCGTPVIAYAKGSVPEIVKDGVTGFLVNPNEEEKTGDWIIKKTGIEGLYEAVERLYSLSADEYSHMRSKCRTHIETNFSIEKMVDNYEKVYYSLL